MESAFVDLETKANGNVLGVLAIKRNEESYFISLYAELDYPVQKRIRIQDADDVKDEFK